MASNQPPINNQSPRRAPTTWTRRSILTAIGIALALFLILGLYQTWAPMPPDTIGWLDNIHEATATAAQTGKPVLIRFSANWCPPCQQMKRTVYPQQQVASLIQQAYVPLDVDLTQNGAPGQPLAEQYGVESIPTLIILDPQGRELSRLSGGVNETILMQWLQSFKVSVPQEPNPPQIIENHS